MIKVEQSYLYMLCVMSSYFQLPFISLCCFTLLTIRLTDHRSIIRTVARLYFPPSDLQLVRIGQVGPAHVAHPLLLTSSTLGHIDRHPGGPRSVPLYLWTGLQVTSLVLLKEIEVKLEIKSWSHCSAGFSLPPNK